MLHLDYLFAYSNVMESAGEEPFLKRERDQALNGLIQAIDTCDHALKMHDDEGLRLILTGMLRAATAAGLVDNSPIQGDAYSPHTMEAVGSVDGGEENTVSSLVLRGWLHRGHPWRLASVTVYRGGPAYLPQGRKGRRRRGNA
jgi:molecular chaperone GrpE (heat shock protein)